MQEHQASTFRKSIKQERLNKFLVLFERAIAQVKYEDITGGTRPFNSAEKNKKVTYRDKEDRYRCMYEQPLPQPPIINIHPRRRIVSVMLIYALSHKDIYLSKH